MCDMCSSASACLTWSPYNEQIDHYSKKQPAFLGGNVSDVAGPRLVGRGWGEVAIQKVRRNRQIVPAVGGCDTKAPLAAGANAVLLHQPLHTLLAYANALSSKLPPDPRPAVNSTSLCRGRTDVRQQRLVAQMAAAGYLPAPRQVLVIAGYAYAEHAALHPDRPDPFMNLNKGILHFWPFASRVARRNFTSALSQNRT